VVPAANAAETFERTTDSDLDVILLDLGLPDADGKEVIQRIRQWSSVPIIVVSARHQQEEKISALDSGADDYVDKPFDVGELLARIRSNVRRREPGIRSDRFESRELEIDFGTRTVRLHGTELHLSPKEYDLLRTLAQHAGQVVTHKKLLTAGWGAPSGDVQYLRSYMAILRQKVEEDPSEPRLILTEPGVGYRLAATL
jgi:two-component system KDP operon response regulator KdpE